MVIEWARLGPWDHLLGFSVYHSRGDVWLPTPPVAADFFRGMVSTGSTLFAMFFLAASVLIFFRSRSPGVSPDESRGFLDGIFYGDAPRLSVKYFVFLFISFVAPFFYNFMWRFHVARSCRIAGGLAISIATFAIVLIIAELFVTSLASQRRQAPGV